MKGLVTIYKYSVKHKALIYLHWRKIQWVSHENMFWREKGRAQVLQIDMKQQSLSIMRNSTSNRSNPLLQLWLVGSYKFVKLFSIFKKEESGCGFDVQGSAEVLQHTKPCSLLSHEYKTIRITSQKFSSLIIHFPYKLISGRTSKCFMLYNGSTSQYIFDSLPDK